MNTLELLLTRRSVTAKDMQEPGPSEAELQQILQAAHRVPDHGKLGPWKFIVFQGEARKAFGAKLAEIYQQNNPDASEKLLAFQADLLLRAPLVIAVVSTAAEHVKIPIWEQELAAGAACQNMLVAATALGYGSQWLTEWYSYDERVKELLGVNPENKIAGFMYFGSFSEKPQERVRPALEERIEYWGK